ncbi:MAG: hypothetical protein H0V82_04520 [Candidatus Protochlamydia sp.]|nr:hypothetical protein [Candidatus Protochlamydia sp.]
MITPCHYDFFNSICNLFLKPDSLQPRSDAETNQIALDETILTHNCSLDFLSIEDLYLHFIEHIQKLKQDQTPEQYAFLFREAEQSLLRLEKNTSSSQYNLVDLRNELQTLFKNSPDGPSTLTQLDVDCFKRMSIIPNDIICLNTKGEKFAKPPISTNSLLDHFNRLSFSKVMFNRAVKDFESIEEVCDIIFLKVDKKYSFFNYLNYADKNLVEQVQKVIDYFKSNNLAQNLGYSSSTSIMIKDLKNNSQSKRLIEQEFDICTILTYKKITELTS